MHLTKILYAAMGTAFIVASVSYVSRSMQMKDIKAKINGGAAHHNGLQGRMRNRLLN